MDDFESKITAYVEAQGTLSAQDARYISRLRGLSQQFSAWNNRDKDAPFDGEAFGRMMRAARLLVEQGRKRRGETTDHEDAPGLATMKALEDLLNPTTRLRAVVRMKMQKFVAGFPAEVFETARQALSALSETEARQVRYMLKAFATEDCFGIIVRGYVLIENMLDSCINSFVPNPLDLFHDLRMMGVDKIRLAHMLGVISKDEQELLNLLNTLRNKVAHARHKFPSEVGPDFEFTWQEEKSLWLQFVKNNAVQGEWPRYDRNRFPDHTRYAFVHAYIMLSGRVNYLKQHRLTPIAASHTEPEDQRTVAPLLAVALAKAFQRLDAFDVGVNSNS